MEKQSDNLESIGSNILFGNIQGLYISKDLNKPSILLDMAKIYDAFCICLCETHLSDNISDSEIVTEGWNIFRSDRKDRICGGVSIYINENIPISEKFTFSNSMCETVGIFLPLSEIVIITTYRPPNCSHEKFQESICAIKEWIATVVKTCGNVPKIFLNGDLNFPTMADWDDNIITKFNDNTLTSQETGRPLSVTNAQIKILYEITEEWLLSQNIYEEKQD